MNLLDQLNPMQRQAAQIIDGPLLLLAGAGSGKTRVLTYRMAYMVEQGIDPFNILAITFTNKAAREMKERVEHLIPGGANIWVATFHSTCVRILRRHIQHLGYDNSFTIYDTSDTEKLMKEILKERNINPKLFPPKNVLGEIGRAKDELLSPDEYARRNVGEYRSSIIAELYEAYQKRLKANNALDFDDLICKTIDLLTLCPEILEKYQSRFQYIMVDEYQDTNTAQYRFVAILARKYRNLCVVGDDDQSIYGWRGANINNILDFEKDYPDAKTIKLEQNYRSTKNILDAANAVIANNKGRKGKNLWTERDGGDSIYYHKARSDFDEAEYVANSIVQSVQNGRRLSDFAILYRMNAQSRALEDKLVHSGIRYRIYGGVRFYERMEVKDVLAYLRGIANPADDISLKRIINVPKRGIGDATVDLVSQYGNINDLSFSGALKEIDNYSQGARNTRIKDFVSMMEGFRNDSQSMGVAELLNKVLEITGYLAGLVMDDSDESRDRAANVQELITKATEFEKTAEDKSLNAFLEDVALVADIDNFTENDDAVVMMTLHSSKGLEFPCVFIPGFEEGIFPGYRSMMSPDPTALEEERRLCYVGITRAKEQLFLVTANQRRMNGEVVCNAPSRFLQEIPAKLVDGLAPVRRPVYRESYRSEESVYFSRGDSQTSSQSGGDTGTARYAVPQVNRNIATGKPQMYKANQEMPKPSSEPPAYQVGDKVRQMKYGTGTVTDIKNAGIDYEVTVEFPTTGRKKFMAHLSKLTKVE